jgi:energy-coupling factor transporter ATP-binding protein EcfA2
VSALSIAFCRFVIRTGTLTCSSSSHPTTTNDGGKSNINSSSKWYYYTQIEFTLRTISSILMGMMAYNRMRYDFICAFHLWTHAMPWLMGCFVAYVDKKKKKMMKKNDNSDDDDQPPSLIMSLGTSILALATLPMSLLFCQTLTNSMFQNTITTITPQPIKDLLGFMFPISELSAAYNIISTFVSNKVLLHDMLKHLLFVTFHIQVGMGHIGIDFLTSEQRRKNMLIRMDVDNPDPDSTSTAGGAGSADSEGKSGGGQPKYQVGTDISKEFQDPSTGKMRMYHGKVQKYFAKEKLYSIVFEDGDSEDMNEEEVSRHLVVPTSTKTKEKKKKKFDPSRKFRRSAPTFIICFVLPYMIQIILFGNLNNYVFMFVRNSIHRSIRIHELFDHESHLEAIANDSAQSPDDLGSAMDTVVSNSYDIINRKLFSLPKLLILPGVISRQPNLLVKIFPLIFLTDMLKGKIVATVTERVEKFQKEARDMNSIRQKVEQFDLKNAELLRRSGMGATKFTQRRWDEFTIDYQAKMAAGDLLRRTRGFYMWLQRNFVFVVLIDCALAKLLAEGSIIVAEIFVFSRAIEDVVDLLLIRSRSESELATLMTQVDKLKVLDDLWSKSKEARLLPCRVRESKSGDNTSNSIELTNVAYTRGTASIAVEHLVIEKGIYAVTGANGSGKSTLFRLLMACESNAEAIDLHDSINIATPLHHWDLKDKAVPAESCKVPDEGCVVEEDNENEEVPITSIVMPSSEIVEISQTFYWPLYSTPIDWIHQKHISSEMDDDAREKCVRRVATELQSLSFAAVKADSSSQSTSEDSIEAAIRDLMNELQTEKEDWFSALSGGQKSKVELVRRVFLRDECPSVLLIDETFAPLDPASKSDVMARLKSFCKDSVVLVIYHTDVGASNSDDDECVPSSGFFTHNLHVMNNHLVNRPVC